MAVGLTLRLLRHGRTDWSDEGRYTGHADIGLNDAGRRAVAALVLPDASYESVVSSDLRRCRETADLLGLRPRLDPALREFDFGALEGMCWEELDATAREALADYDRFVAPGGESVAQFGDRLEHFVSTIDDGHHLLITHGGVIQHLLRNEGRADQVGAGEWIDLEISRR